MNRNFLCGVLIVVVSMTTPCQGETPGGDHGHSTGQVTKCPAVADIIFVLDTSYSVNQTEYQMEIDFAVRLTEHFNIGERDVRVAALTFSDRVYLNFHLGTYTGNAALKQGLINTTYLGGSTKTFLALDYIRVNQLFNFTYGGRATSSKIVVVLTDGISDDQAATTLAAANLRNTGVKIIAVGIGAGLESELANIGGDPEYVYSADDFNSMNRIELRVATGICSIPEIEGNIPTGPGERIALSATPTTFTPGKTPELTVRCGLEDNGTSSVNRVDSIVIKTVDGGVQKEVARIVRGQAATGGFSTKGATVTGDVSSRTGYLQVTWPSPRHGQAGQYICDISALTTIGDNTKFRSSIQVVSTGKSTDSSDSTQCQCTEAIEALKTAVGRDVDSLKNTVNDLKTNIGGLSSVHNEEGIVSCRNSDAWNESLTNDDGFFRAKTNDRETVVDVRFSSPYAKNPLVVISPVVLDVYNDYNLRYRIAIRDVTPTGFKVVCGTWSTTRLHHIEVRWISIVA